MSNGFTENEISQNAFGGTEIAKRKLAKIIDPKLLENTQIISSRIRELDPAKIRILWLHDLPEDPESQKLKEPSFRDKFHKFVFISNWQYQQYRTVLGMEYSDKCVVLESGIDPIEAELDTKSELDRINFVYTSTPQRGLNILLPVFEALAKKYDDVHLDVFSSFKIYGWDSHDKEFESYYERIRNHPNMTYYGFTPHDELTKHLAEVSHIFAYPCIWTETSCRAMIEAMSAGVMCVHPNFGALPDTSGNLNFMYQGDSDLQKHANIFYASLEACYLKTKESRQELNKYLRYVKSYVDNRYGIPRVKFQWEDMLTQLNTKYPTVESRKLPSSETFSYSTG